MAEPGANDGRLTFAVEQHHLLLLAVAVAADDAGGVGKVVVIIALKDNDELMVGLLVEDEVHRALRLDV